MKKLTLLVLVLIASITFSYAQDTVTFTLVTTPCDTNGVLVAHIPTTVSLPYAVYWNGGTTHRPSVALYGYFGINSKVDTITSGYTDTLWNYTGDVVYTGVLNIPALTPVSGIFPGMPPINYTFTTVNPHCPSTIGGISVSAIGGTPPYTYNWYHYGSSTSIGTTSIISGTPGYFGVDITDAAGCVFGSNYNNGGYDDSARGFDSIVIIPALSITTASTIASCTNGTASFTIDTGGTSVPPYTYLWSNGATTPSISGLVMGIYTVTVTDANGCSASKFVEVSQSVTINDSLIVTPATCLATNGGIIDFPSGGMPPYSYAWSNGATTQGQTGLTPGFYIVTATDANGCTGSNYNWITTSSPITVTYTATPSACTTPTGTATLSIVGGTLPYNITWYTSPVQTTATATGLMAGNYNFHIVDAVGCVQNGTVVIPPIETITISYTSTPALCTLANGTISATAIGGLAPYSYLWTTGATTSSISGQPAGTYYVTVTDANGCSATHCSNIYYVSPVMVSFSTTPSSCLFNNDGAANMFAYGGTPPYNYHWNTGATTSTISGIPSSAITPGSYWGVVTDAAGCTSDWSYTNVGYNLYDSSCFCVIKGRVYYDINDNCVQDPGEPGVHHIQIHCSGMGYTYTNDSGYYYFLVPSGTYTVSETVLAYYPLSSCQSNNVVVTASAATGCVIHVNFANVINPIQSVHISTWDIFKPIPGNIYHQSCLITNEGTVTDTTILSKYKTDGQLFGASYTPSGIFTLDSLNCYGTEAGSGLTLSPGVTQHFEIQYNVPTFIPLGTNVIFKDTVAHVAPISNWLTDYSPWNNVNYFTTTVVSSFDPNFKEVSPKGTTPYGIIGYEDSILQYMVHFQNTGTSPAQNIVVIDTIDANLDWTTLTPVYESAPCKISLNNAGVATFTFKNINLPAAGTTNLLSSNGMFTYTIKTRSRLPYGTQFRNSASIYFDYNAPIKTNTTLNTLVAVNEVNKIAAINDFFKVYPNPAANTVSIQIDCTTPANAQMNIADISGRTLISKTLDLQAGLQTITQSLNQLANGIYFVTLNMDGKLQTQKLVVMR